MSSTPAPWWRRDGDDLLLHLHVQPGARSAGPVGRHDQALKLRIQAPAVDGRANQALCRHLARALGLRPRQVVIEQGMHSREKVMRLRNAAALAPRLAAWDRA